MRQLISDITRYANRNSTLDLIFTNMDHVLAYGVIDVNISDHLMVFCSKKKELAPKEKVKFEGRSYKHYDKTTFQGNLCQKDWSNFDQEADPQKAWDIMLGIITEEIDQMCPIKTFNIKKT